MPWTKDEIEEYRKELEGRHRLNYEYTRCLRCGRPINEVLDALPCTLNLKEEEVE